MSMGHVCPRCDELEQAITANDAEMQHLEEENRRLKAALKVMEASRDQWTTIAVQRGLELEDRAALILPIVDENGEVVGSVVSSGPIEDESALAAEPASGATTPQSSNNKGYAAPPPPPTQGEGDDSYMTPAQLRDYIQDLLRQRSDEAARAENEACAKIAIDGCLVPPDGGSPTEDERMMCENIAAAIRARQEGK